MSWWLSFSQTQFIKLIFRKSLSRTAVCANSSLNDINFIIDKNRRLTKLFFFHKTPHLGFVDRFHSRTHDKKNAARLKRNWPKDKFNMIISRYNIHLQFFVVKFIFTFCYLPFLSSLSSLQSLCTIARQVVSIINYWITLMFSFIFSLFFHFFFSAVFLRPLKH